jgi:hypothetical protein
MQTQPSQANARDALVERLVRARYTLVVWAVCGREQIHTPRHDACCPECGGGVHRSIARFRDLCQEQR